MEAARLLHYRSVCKAIAGQSAFLTRDLKKGSSKICVSFLKYLEGISADHLQTTYLKPELGCCILVNDCFMYQFSGPCLFPDVSEIGRSAKSYCEHTARTQPTLSDIVVTLVEMGE